MNLKDSLDVLRKTLDIDVLKLVLDNVEQAARSDDKTPLQNALALSEAKEVFGASEESPNIVIFADINDFKFVNGKYGSANGDAAISQVGIMIQEIFVKNCKAQAFRQSGDEFIILLHEKFISKFKKKVKAFESCRVQSAEVKFSVGVSFGYVVSDGTFDFEKIRTRAENACKEAKKQGDGICVEWIEEIERTAIQSLRKNCTNCGAVTSCYVPQKMNLNSIQFCAACGATLVKSHLK